MISRLRSVALLAAMLLPGAQASADAVTPTSVLVQGNGTSSTPDTVPIDTTEPVSVVNRQSIERLVAPTGNYDEIVALTPSVLDIDPNGPGLGETQVLTIRGFTDGQYNVTFDGIPFGDSDDFTHHSAAYFTARDLGAVAVDRGPGDATTIGDATFGGTIALRSIDPAATASASPGVTLGTFGTVLGGARLDSGSVGESRFLIDGEGAESDGALDGVRQRRGTLFAKLTSTLGPRTELTIATNIARTVENDPPGATKAQIASGGPGVALNDDPSSQEFSGYNASRYTTDLSYATLTTGGEAGWSASDTLYTYGLDRHFVFGLDPNGDTPNGTVFGAADVPGQSAKNGLRAFGDIVRASLPLDRLGLVLHGGFWLERQTNSRRLDEVDLTDGDVPNPILPVVPGVPGSAAIEREQAQRLVTAQPYAAVEWHGTRWLVLDLGLKGAIFARSVDAPVMEGTRLPTVVDRIFAAPLPSATARLVFRRDWQAYAQAARGFLAPPLQFFDVSSAQTAPVSPEATWNFQVGTVWHGAPASFAADLYDILFTNEVGSRTVAGETVDYDAGSATYRGAEAEGSVALGRGLSLAGNASVNGGRQSGGRGPVPNLPQATATGGVFYERGPWNASVVDHWTGGFYGDVGGTEWIDPVNTVDLALGRRFHARRTVPVRLQAQLFNLLDQRRIDGLAGYTADGTPLYWTEAGRSLFVSATASF